MNNRERVRYIKRAQKFRSFLRDERYIEAQITKRSLNNLTIQMGPECIRECGFCYGEYGPKRKGLPRVHIVRKAIKESIEMGLERVCLSDGEPLWHRNKTVMGEICRHSSLIPVYIITNGVFARTENNAKKWMEFLRANLFDLCAKGNFIDISCGIKYDVKPNNYLKINMAVKKVYPGCDFGKHMGYRMLVAEKNVGEIFEHVKSIEKNLEASFGAKKNSRVMGGNRKNFGFCFYPDGGTTPIQLILVKCRPYGRAYNFNIFNEEFREKDLEVNDLGFHPDTREGLWLGHDGKVSFAVSGQCVSIGRFYGNVKTEHLGAISKRISEDDIYRGFALGGAKFMYYLAREVDSDFKVRGRTRCNVCNSFFNNLLLVGEVRNKLLKQGLVETYKRYIKGIDLRKNPHI